MAIKTIQHQTQKQILAPSMQQSIEVLLLPLAELHTAIDQELQENPLLEVDEEQTKAEQSQLEEFIDRNLKYLTEHIPSSTNTHSNFQDEDDLPNDNQITRATPLEDYLLQQLRIEINDPDELHIGELIIGHIDEDGYLTSSDEEIATISGLRNINLVKKVLTIIQGFDPIGIASLNLKECLLKQVPFRFNGNSEIISKMIIHHLDDLGKKKFNSIARQMKIPVENVKAIAQNIALLEPKPARKHRPITQNIYIKPDIYIKTDEENNYTIEINRQDVPILRLNSFYQNLLKKKVCSDTEKEFIREKVQNALNFIRSIEQRHKTVSGIAQYILDHQKEFFENGPSAIKPMKLKDVAESIERNESTISRAVNNKYMETPQGLYPLKFFFSQAVSNNTGAANAEDQGKVVSNRTIKEALKELINDEDKSKPFSDQAIEKHFKEKGTPVARRTIAKYRKLLNILPSHLRKE